MAINTKVSYELTDGDLFHIITYGRNNMPPHATQIPQADRWKLIHFLRDLQENESARLEKMGLVFEEQEDPRRHSLVSVDYGRELYDANCGSCHGKDGRYPVQGAPTLNHPRVLAVAADDYYLDIITHGRKGTQMAAWEKNLTPTQIRSLVKYFRSWIPERSDRDKVARSEGSIRMGKALFRGNCAGCHGTRGQGGIGNALNSPSFLAVASDSFLRDTISIGRKHTAMPSGAELSNEDMSDILAWIRSWAPPKSSWGDVKRLLPDANARIGKKIYRAKCASCHDKKGEGGIGSRLNSQSFLALAEDEFLYRAIAEGRPGTAMPAWGFLSNEDVADLITFIRDWQKIEPNRHAARHNGGRAQFGEMLYRMACRACHGPESSGGVGGQLGNPVFLDSASDHFLWHTIAHGKDGTAMRGFLEGTPGGALVPMAASDIDHIIAYLRQIQSMPRMEPLKRVRTGTSIALGKEIFETKGGCAKCHGAQGEGASGPAIGNPDFLRVASDGYLAATTILGRENTEMLSFYRGGNVKLSQEDVENVVGYIRSFENRTHMPPRRVESTDTIVGEGKKLFVKNCAGCHGSDGLGPALRQTIPSYAPSINNQEFLKAADDGFLLATIAMGRPGTPMRPFAKGLSSIAELSTEEIRQIVAFIRSWQKGSE